MLINASKTTKSLKRKRWDNGSRTHWGQTQTLETEIEMTDQTLNQHTKMTTAPINTLLARVLSFLSRKQSTKPCLDLSPIDRARLDRGLPASKRLRQDIGVSAEYSRHDARNDVANMCIRNGMPL